VLLLPALLLLLLLLAEWAWLVGRRLLLLLLLNPCQIQAAQTLQEDRQLALLLLLQEMDHPSS
jgi:hypothetical protein